MAMPTTLLTMPTTFSVPPPPAPPQPPASLTAQLSLNTIMPGNNTATAPTTTATVTASSNQTPHYSATSWFCDNLSAGISSAPVTTNASMLTTNICPALTTTTNASMSNQMVFLPISYQVPGIMQVPTVAAPAIQSATLSGAPLMSGGVVPSINTSVPPPVAPTQMTQSASAHTCPHMQHPAPSNCVSAPPAACSSTEIPQFRYFPKFTPKGTARELPGNLKKIRRNVPTLRQAASAAITTYQKNGKLPTNYWGVALSAEQTSDDGFSDASFEVKSEYAM
ncbi:mucin-2-like [Ceratitis capitata]|uniref:mucin-2-like n=1 Tax=Ceratitis capitata TaxID=7213 RepID=UPI000A0F575D|nr:mucin-2-like [Ceratitis capitata]